MNITSQKKSISFSKLLAVVILAALTFEGVSMSFFSKTEEEVFLFSEMEGHITFNGKPVKNVKVERRVNWKDDIGEKDFVITNHEGHFLLPEIKQTLKISGFSQFVVGQEIKVVHKEKEYFIWSMGKRTKNKYGELEGVPINFRCELTDEDKPMRLESGLLVTKCTWDKIENNITE